MSAVADWTRGEDGIVFQCCKACDAAQYFRRAFCASCGATAVEDRQASGRGVIYAVTIVGRAATDETRARVPYAILLVDMVEGFRMMAHGDNTLAIGDGVLARFDDFVGKRVPYFEKAR